MSVTNLFNFSRSLPAPFDTLRNKKVKVSSKYGSGMESTLCSSAIKAIHALCRCMDGSSEGAVGTIDNRTVAEYKSSIGPDSYHLVVYDTKAGNLLASVYDKSTEVMEVYTLNNSGRDGAAVLMAMMPAFMEDEEFSKHLESYHNHMNDGFSDLSAATDDMAILCDNMYRRVKDETCAAHVKVVLDKSGNLMRISQTQLDSGAYTPNDVIAGEFTVFAQTGPVVIKRSTNTVEHSDFISKYQFNPGRSLSPLEKSLVPQLPAWYIIPDEVVDICKHANATTGKAMPMRNFLLRGPAGTGKTMGAKAIAAGLNLPYMKYTCSAGTEIFDFVGMIFPETDSVSTGDAELDREREALKAMGGINYAMRTVTQLIESEEDEERPTHIFQSIAQLLLSYVKYGEIKYGEASKKDERIQLVFSLISDLDNAIMVTSGKERLKTVNLVLVRCWDYIESFIEVCKQRQDDAKAAGEETSVSETLAKAFGSVVGGSCAGEGDTIPVPEPRTSSCPACNAGKRKATKAIAEGSDEEDNSSSSESENAVSDEKEDDASDNSENSTTASQSSIGDDGVESGALSGNGKKNVSSEEEGRIPYQQTESVSEPTGGETSYNDDYQREHYENAASDIERLLDKMAEKAACEQLENERLRELNEAAQNISYGDIHAGVQIRVNRIADVDNELIEQYDQISAPLIRISKQLQKSIVQQLKDRQRGGKQTGLVMGRRLDAHALCRNDGKVFYKNALPNEVPQISVGLLLDESGSMSSCDRCTYARAAAIILYDFCHSLGIPVTIYGHTTGYDSVELFSYAEFQDIDQDDKYRLMDISARGSNRDGAALRFVAEKMVKRPEEIRILMLISDGQPADSGYYGAAAEEDLRGIKQEYRRKGLLFIAAAIGDDKQNIERIYGDSFMDITDLNQLPIKLTAVVKRHIGV